jgi:hypothetical protein
LDCPHQGCAYVRVRLAEMEKHCLEKHGLIPSEMPALIPRPATSTDLVPIPPMSKVDFTKLKSGEGVVMERSTHRGTEVSIPHIVQQSNEAGKWKAPVGRQVDFDEEVRLVLKRNARAEKGSLLLSLNSECEILTLTDSFP